MAKLYNWLLERQPISLNIGLLHLSAISTRMLGLSVVRHTNKSCHCAMVHWNKVFPSILCFDCGKKDSWNFSETSVNTEIKNIKIDHLHSSLYVFIHVYLEEIIFFPQLLYIKSFIRCPGYWLSIWSYYLSQRKEFGRKWQFKLISNPWMSDVW